MAYNTINLACEVENVNIYKEGKDKKDTEWAVIVTYKVTAADISGPLKNKSAVYKGKQIIIPAANEEMAKIMTKNNFAPKKAFALKIEF